MVRPSPSPTPMTNTATALPARDTGQHPSGIVRDVVPPIALAAGITVGLLLTGHALTLGIAFGVLSFSVLAGYVVPMLFRMRKTLGRHQ
jgi:hypothetical protein